MISTRFPPRPSRSQHRSRAHPYPHCRRRPSPAARCARCRSQEVGLGTKATHVGTTMSSAFFESASRRARRASCSDCIGFKRRSLLLDDLRPLGHQVTKRPAGCRRRSRTAEEEHRMGISSIVAAPRRPDLRITAPLGVGDAGLRATPAAPTRPPARAHANSQVRRRVGPITKTRHFRLFPQQAIAKVSYV